MNIATNIAREAIENYFNNYKVVEPNAEQSKWMSGILAGVYVALLRADDEIRSIGGTVLPTRNNLASEITHAAIKAAVGSVVYEPITKTELKGTKIIVDIISELTAVTRNHLIDTQKEGIFVESLDKRHGIILPNIYANHGMAELVDMTCYQAKINPQIDHYRIFIFKTERYQE